MPFKFVHTADWHIAKPFGGFPAEIAVRLREARLEVLDSIAEEAVAFGAADVLVAGDVLDSPGVADEVIARLLARLAKHAGLRWHLLPGNHDAAATGGIWDRIRRYGLPANVAAHLVAEPVELASDVVLLPAPLGTRHTASDPTRWMDEAATAEGKLRIGLAHGAVRGFGAAGGSSVPLAIDRAATAGLAYLALGDWHGMREAAPRTWYAGTPEPDRFLDNGPGHILAVEVRGASAVVVTPRRVARHTWLKRAVDAGGSDPLAAIEAEVAALGAACDQAVVQLAVAGSLTLAEDQALRARLAALGPRLMHLDARLDYLTISVAEADGDWDPAVAGVARRLSERLENATSEHDAAVLRHALRRLAELAAAGDQRNGGTETAGGGRVAA